MKRPDKKELKKYNVLYPKDTNFAAHARLLQSRWREHKGYEMDTKINYGNYIDTKLAINKKVNFLTDNIKELVTRTIKEVRNQGGLISEPRIWNNLLSSQPLCFNLFGEMKLDLNLATRFFQKLFPSIVSSVTCIEFEYSDKRGMPDNSAFDVYVEYLNKENKEFFGIEVKYQESLKEESSATAKKVYNAHKNEYLDLTLRSGYYKSNTIEKLQTVPLCQIWRDHLLSFNMSNDDISGSFIFLYPFENEKCSQAVIQYQELLANKDEDENKFYPRNLSDFIRTLNQIYTTDWTNELVVRYLGK